MSKDRRAKIVADELGIAYAHAFRLTREVMSATTQKFTIDELVAACRERQEDNEKRYAALSGWEEEKRRPPQ